MSTIKVEGMHCGHCSNSIKNALEKINAKMVEVDLENGLVRWSGEPDAEEVKKAIDDQGFTAILG